MQIQQHSFFLTSGDGQLAATAWLPDAVCGAVLFLLPLAEERKGTLPFYQEVARDLYRSNIASLIFDWQGTGDSSGEFESTDPARFSADLDAALKWLQATLPGTPVTALGTRLAALLLTQPDVPLAAVQRRVLIAPASGSEFMHQLLQRRMVNDMVAYGKATESRAALLEKLSTGSSVDLDGFVFSAAMYQWISEIRGQESGDRGQVATDIQFPNFHVPQTLLISGGHSPKTLKAMTSRSESAEISGIRFPPFWNTVGHVDLSELITAITGWIAEAPAVDSLPFQPPEFRCYSAQAALIEIAVKEGVIRAAVDRPEEEPTAGVLFLPGWSGDRTGPHRLFTQLARRLTQAGHICLRPDFRGRGLSDGAHADASIDSMAEDAAAALTALRQLLPQGAPVDVVAICSGCKVAITLAAAHPSIDRLLLLSAESMGSLRSRKTDAGKTRTAIKTYLRKLTQPETWKKILTGRVQAKMVTKALVQHETRSDDEAQREDQTLRLFEQYAHPVHFVFGGSDPDAPGSMQAYTEYCAKHRIPHTLHLVPHAGHSYYSAGWTREVFETGIAFLKS